MIMIYTLFFQERGEIMKPDKEEIFKFYTLLFDKLHMEKIFFISVMVFIIGCGEDKKNNHESNPNIQSECSWYEIGTWKFPPSNDLIKSTFSFCGVTDDGFNLVKIESVDALKVEYLEFHPSFPLPSGRNGGL